LQHAYGLEVPQNLKEACDPRRIALVVYDMQVGILRQIQGGEAVTAKVAAVLRVARDAGMRVFFLRHMSLPKELMGVFQLRMAMAWQRVGSVDEVKPWFLRDSPGFQILPEVAPLPSEAVFDKITMSAFKGTPLDIALRDCGINAFLIAGVAMEIGIEPCGICSRLCSCPSSWSSSCRGPYSAAPTKRVRLITRCSGFGRSRVGSCLSGALSSSSGA